MKLPNQEGTALLCLNESLLPRGGGKGFVPAATVARVNPQPLDFLIERGNRNQEAFRRFCLVPPGPLEHVHACAPPVHRAAREEIRRAAAARRGRSPCCGYFPAGGRHPLVPESRAPPRAPPRSPARAHFPANRNPSSASSPWT